VSQRVAKRDEFKMADEDKDGVERDLARIVEVTEKSGNLRNDLRKDGE